MILYSPFPSRTSSRVEYYCVKMMDYLQVFFLIDFSEAGERSFKFFFLKRLNLKLEIMFAMIILL